MTKNDSEIKDIKDIFKVLKVFFTSIIEDIVEFSGKDDLIRLAVQSPDFDYPIQLPFMKTSLLSVEHILSEIERVLLSFEKFMFDEAFEINIIHIKYPKAAVWSSYYMDLDSFLKNKQCIVHIKNKDELCCARAIITAKAKIDNHLHYKNSIKMVKGLKVNRLENCMKGQMSL